MTILDYFLCSELLLAAYTTLEAGTPDVVALQDQGNGKGNWGLSPHTIPNTILIASVDDNDDHLYGMGGDDILIGRGSLRKAA